MFYTLGRLGTFLRQSGNKSNLILMNIFRVVVITLFSVIFVYICHQLTRFSGLSVSGSLRVILFLGAIFALVLSMPLYFWSDRRLVHKPWHDAFFSASHFAMAYLNFLVSFVVLRDLAAAGIYYSPVEFDVDLLYDTNALGLMLALPFLLIILGTIIVRVGPKIKTVPLSFPDLPADLEGFKILHITDLHISSGLPVKFVARLAETAQRVQADIVVYTGDILDSSAYRHVEEFELLKTIRAPLGVFYVPGNHEYYWKIEQALTAFRGIGAEVLMNETANIVKGTASLQVAGIPDPAARMFQQEMPDLKKLTQQMQNGSFKILLAHQPFIADEASNFGFNLQLSGHTHGGQFFPWNFLIGFFQKYAKGLYQVKNMQLYVNQGTGYWGPSLRLGTYCELTQIVLRKSGK